jgi:recombinational DNA repair ATPase RecF
MNDMTTKPLSAVAALRSLQAKHKKLSAVLERLSKAGDAVDTARLELDNALEVLVEAQNRPASQLSAVSSQPSAKPARNGSKKVAPLAQKAGAEEE